MNTSETVISLLREIADPGIAKHSLSFFKAGPGEYAEGDKFLGVRVPDQRKIARKHRKLSLEEVKKLLKSELHEVRLTGLLILVYQYEKADSILQEKIYHFYMDHLEYVNNWDLVDSSAKYIAGHFLFDKDRSLLHNLAKSDNLWDRRVAVLSTFYFIDRGDFPTTIEISENLLNDQDDFIHKAVGWMLREIGNNDKPTLISFLKKHYKKMPRTMLRYAIEKFPKEERDHYLKGTV
ncbi:MAG: DNA alkylation repair protein [Balneolaceae bacterium]|nr:DNA alkylation repair protein [Balneolaceae bacterium]